MIRKMLLAAVALAPFAAMAAELPASIRAKGTMVVANVPNYPPMEMKDPATGKLVGFDIDLGEAIAKRLGLTIQWQETSFDQMIASLRTGRVDVILSGMSDKPDRRGVADFVDYLRSGSQVFTQARRAGELNTLESLCGRSVGASRRTNFVVVLKEWSDANCVAKGKPAINVIGTEGSADARTQLRQGRIDAAMQGGETLPYIMAQEPNTYALVGEPMGYTLMGIATNKEQPAMQAAIAEALKALVADGTYAALLKKWSLDASGITEVTVNAGE
ncbi:ABC transporter substrate-binding protein [Acetobacteraceae bacterium H6797]|nr:ABC transporter substrate-binding protein [Acetobacteraceae bacterium H6797]